jgi:hypothetical protein
MILTKFAGLGDVKRPGLSVSAAAERLLCLAYIEKRLMFLCAAKMISVPQRDLKVLLGRQQYNAAGRCHLLRERLRQMRTAKVRIDAIPNERLAIFLDEALFYEESGEIAQIIWWIHRRLLGSYEEYLATTNPLADAPTCDLIETFLSPLRSSVECLRAHLDQLGIAAEASLPSDLQKFGVATGEIAGFKARGEPVARERSTQPFIVPRKAGRDDGLNRVWDYVKPPMEDVADYLTYMLGIRLSEINVAEGLAVVLCETKDMPWEFYRDISRHLWDEVRHSMMGEAAIEATFGTAGAIPMREYESAYCMEASALEQYATLGLEIEGAQMKYPIGKRGEWEFCRDAAKHPLMTTFQDFDWADEVLHVTIAKRQLNEWSLDGTRELSALAEEGKQNRTRVKERQPPVRISSAGIQLIDPAA